MFRNSKLRRPFERCLPGGGFVAIEVASTKSLWRKPRFDGRVVVERRAASRGENHRLPVIATASSSSFEEVVEQLLPAAQSNVSIGAALLRLGARDRQTQAVGV